MKPQDIMKMDKDDVLGLLGLEMRHSAASRVLWPLGTLGLGLLVGAGMGLLLAPKPGSELRHDIRTKIRRAGKGMMPEGLDATDAVDEGDEADEPRVELPGSHRARSVDMKAAKLAE